MKWMHTAISAQNLFLKLAIFIIGIATALDSSLRQLVAQIILFCLYLLLQPSLFRHLLKAFRRILPFFAGYWLFATLFGQSFPGSVLFSIQIIYLILVSVAVFAEVSMGALAHDSKWARRNKWVNALFYYCFATMLYLHSFFFHYHELKPNAKTNVMINSLGDVFGAVTADTDSIKTEVRNILNSDTYVNSGHSYANPVGIVFLAVLVIVHGL